LVDERIGIIMAPIPSDYNRITNDACKSYPGISLKGKNVEILLDKKAKRLLFRPQRKGAGEQIDPQMQIEDIENAYLDDRKKLSQGTFRFGIISIFLIGAYLTLGEYLKFNERLKISLYIFFFGLSAIGVVLIITYLVLKEKVLILETGKGGYTIHGNVTELNRLRFDIHVLRKGNILREEKKGGDEDEMKSGGSCKNIRLTRGKEPGDGKKRRRIRCPQCGSARLYYEAGLMTGYKYHCKSCDYIGPFVIEMDE